MIHKTKSFREIFYCVIRWQALRLSHAALGETTPGQMVNLLSNDARRFDIIPIYFSSLFTAPLFAIFVSVLLILEVGVPGMIGMLILFITIPIQS